MTYCCWHAITGQLPADRIGFGWRKSFQNLTTLDSDQTDYITSFDFCPPFLYILVLKPASVVFSLHCASRPLSWNRTLAALWIILLKFFGATQGEGSHVRFLVGFQSPKYRVWSKRWFIERHYGSCGNGFLLSQCLKSLQWLNERKLMIIFSLFIFFM